MNILGIDIGGSAIKGGIVNCLTGELLTERYRVETPLDARPEPMIEILTEIVQHFNWQGPIGCGYPGVVKEGRIFTAANLDKSWIGLDIPSILKERTGCPTHCLNDADAAGLAEMHFGSGRHSLKPTMMVTVGTGLGTALFNEGKLYPNMELGHLFMKNGKEAEKWASSAAKDREDLSWKDWAKRFDKYLHLLHSLLQVDLFIIGGGIAHKAEKFLPYLKIPTEVRIAEQGNIAGITGAALAALKEGSA
jgi:polyphosphate glucokinase